MVADAAMLSRTNLESLVAYGYYFIVGSRLTKVPYDIAEFQKQVGTKFIDSQILLPEKMTIKSFINTRKSEQS